MKWNNTLKALEILLKLGHIAKGNNIAEVWVGRGSTCTYLIHDIYITGVSPETVMYGGKQDPGPAIPS